MDILYLEIAALTVCVIILLFPIIGWLRKRYFTGPQLTVEMMPLTANHTNSQILRIHIRNDSPHAAHLPKLLLPKTFNGFDKIEDLNSGESIRSREIRIIDAEFADVGDFESEVNQLQILLEYRNHARSRFYTLYNHRSKSNKIIRFKPAGFARESAC